jgi:hypothetical protein
MEKQTPVATIIEHFSKVDDPRSDNRSHLLIEIILPETRRDDIMYTIIA